MEYRQPGVKTLTPDVTFSWETNEKQFYSSQRSRHKIIPENVFSEKDSCLQRSDKCEALRHRRRLSSSMSISADTGASRTFLRASMAKNLPEKINSEKQ